MTHEDDEIDPLDAESYVSLMRRRAKNEPIAYLVGKKEFFGRNFIVTKDVLIPRPATELLVTETLRLYKEPAPGIIEADADIVIVSFIKKGHVVPERVLDIGTGSGCIAITLALERPTLTVLGVDTSESALAVARHNCDLHTVRQRVAWMHRNGAAAILAESVPFLVVSNPPYIPDGTPLEADVGCYEPHAALYGGSEGKDVLRSIVKSAQRNPACAGWILECKAEQAASLTA